MAENEHDKEDDKLKNWLFIASVFGVDAALTIEILSWVLAILGIILAANGCFDTVPYRH